MYPHNCWGDCTFYRGLCTPVPRTKFLSCLELLALNGITGKNSCFALQPLLAIRFCIAMKKERNLDKESRSPALHLPLSKLNPRQNNSLRSNKFCPVIVSLRNCSKNIKIKLVFIKDNSEIRSGGNFNF